MKSLKHIVAAICVLGVISSLRVHAQGSIVIGLSTPLSGAAVFQGQHDRWGAQLAVEHVNADGGVLGRQLVLDVQDNACNPTEGVNGVGRMIANKDLVAILGAMCSSVTLAIMPVIERANVPLLVGSSSAASITEQAGAGGNIWTFRAGPNDDSMAVALANYLKQVNPGYVKIAYLAENTDYGRGGAVSLTKALRPIGMVVASTDYYDKGTQDFTTVLSRLKMRAPDAIALYSMGVDQINLMRQFRSLGLKIPLTGRVELSGVQQESIASGILNGATAVFQWAPEIDTPANRAFVQAYRARFQEEPLLQSANAYENVLILVDAIRRANSLDRHAIREAIQRTDMPSLIGGRIVFDAHHQAHNNAVILKVEGTTVKVVATPGT